MRPVNNSANQFRPDWKICSLVISQWNLCLAQVWTTIQILQIICNFATWCLNMGRNDIWQGCFHCSLKIFIAPIEELGKFTNSVTVIAWLLFLVAQNNFPLLVSCKTISLTRPPLPVTKCRGVGVVVISSKAQFSPLQKKMGRKMTLAKVAQHVNDFGMKPVKGNFKGGDFHSSGWQMLQFSSTLSQSWLPPLILNVTTFVLSILSSSSQSLSHWSLSLAISLKHNLLLLVIHYSPYDHLFNQNK